MLNASAAVCPSCCDAVWWFHLVSLLFTGIIYADMCRNTESQVWSAAESSSGFSETLNNSDDCVMWNLLVAEEKHFYNITA